MVIQFIIVCLLFVSALWIGIYNFFFMEKKISGIELKTPKKAEKLVKKAKLTGFVFLIVAVLIPVIVFI